jgi:hypothetical protein
MRKRLLPLLWLAAACGADPSSHPVAPAAPPTTASAPAAAPVEAKTSKRVVIVLSRKAGTNVTTVAPDGTVTVTLDVLENGRGPHTDATVRLAPDGTIASLEARGHHTMRTPVAETFTREAGRARWKSHEEDGSREIKESAFFVPACDLPDALGWLAKALLDNGGKMALLPGGTARIEKTVETTVQAGSEQRKLFGYVITGLELAPTHVWLNEDKSWFGFVSAWQSVVPEGWEGSIDWLLAKQREIDRERDRKLAERVAQKPSPAGLAFTNARVLDVEKGRYLADQTVVVVGDTIQSVGPAKAAKLPKDVEVIDLTGKTLIPGLWDMHAHFGDADGVLNIASGVTTARDVGNDPDKLDDFKKRFDDGSAVGPHVIRFGFIEGRGENAASSKVTAETEAEAKAAVESYAKRGYEGIKIYNSMKTELVPFLSKEAHARNMMVTGHIPVHMLAHEAVRAGYDGIEHINMLFLNFFADHDTDTRTTKRFTLVGDKAAAFDLGSKPVTDFIALLKERRTVIDPTLGAFEELLVAEQGKITPGLENVVNRLPVQAQRGFLVGGLPLDADKVKTYRASFDKLLEMVKRLHTAKIPVVAGTDHLAGLMLQHELALLVRAGLSPADALRADTLDAARAMKLDKKSGSIAKGKVADLVVIDGDPLAHIEDITSVVSTVRGGVLFASAPLYEAAGVRPSSK